VRHSSKQQKLSHNSCAHNEVHERLCNGAGMPVRPMWVSDVRCSRHGREQGRGWAQDLGTEGSQEVQGGPGRCRGCWGYVGRTECACPLRDCGMDASS
jgi:hypothetical protein